MTNRNTKISLLKSQALLLIALLTMQVALPSYAMKGDPIGRPTRAYWQVLGALTSVAQRWFTSVSSQDLETMLQQASQGDALEYMQLLTRLAPVHRQNPVFRRHVLDFRPTSILIEASARHSRGEGDENDRLIAEA